MYFRCLTSLMLIVVKKEMVLGFEDWVSILTNFGFR